MIIKGRVIDRQTQQGVAGISVEAVLAEGSDPVGQTVTDESGNFEIPWKQAESGFFSGLAEKFLTTNPPLSVYAVRPLEGGIGEGIHDAEYDGQSYLITIDADTPSVPAVAKSRGATSRSARKKAVSDPVSPAISQKKTKPQPSTETPVVPGSVATDPPRKPTPPTFAERMNQLRPHLAGRSFANLRDSEISAIAEKGGMSKEEVTHLVASHKLAKEVPLPLEFVHALRKNGKSVDRDALVTRPLDQLREELVAAIDKKTASPDVLTEFEMMKPFFSRWQAVHTPLAKLAKTFSQPIPSILLAKLKAEGVTTLSHIRENGGVGNIEGLAVDADDPAVKTLDAHANLSLLPVTPAESNHLIAKEYTDVLSIANTSQTRFVSDMHEQLGDLQAGRVKVSADIQMSVTYNFLTAERTGAESPFMKGGGGAWTASEWHPGEVQRSLKCSCRECESVLSPLAYLTDLLVFAGKKVTFQNKLIVDTALLEKHFFQPFGQLTGSCDASESQVRQVRLCIEVLQRYLAANPPSNAAQAILVQARSQYRLTAYRTLLNKIGTSFEELRLVMGIPADEQALADRLGIALVKLDPLLLDPQAAAGAPRELTEAALEWLFGLPRTDRADPLIEPSQAQFMEWRLEALERTWRQQDHDGPALPKGHPIIDPDVIGPDDFRSAKRKANAGDPDQAFDVWVRRRTWVDDQLKVFQGMTRQETIIPGNPPITVPDLAAMLAAMSQPVSYPATGAAVQMIAWPANFPLADLNSHWDRLQYGNAKEVADATVFISDKLHLSVESFTRLMMLREKDRVWRDTTATTVQVVQEEWKDIYSILVQGQKVATFEKWIEEEQALAIDGGPSLFWIAQRPLRDGEWPPSRPANEPLIEPVTIKLMDLPEHDELRAKAVIVWEGRRKELDDYRLARKKDCEGGQAGFDKMFDNALAWWAPPNAPPNPLPTMRQRVAQLRQELDGDQTRATAEKIVTGTVHLSTDSFRRVAAIEAKAKAGQFPTASEREEVYSILTDAYRVEQWGRWKNEESQQSLKDWELIKMSLPLWRATQGMRSTWQQALRFLRRPVIVDPNTITPVDIKTLSLLDASQPAYKLWADRQQAVRDFRSALTALHGQGVDDQDRLNRVLGKLGFNLTGLAHLAEEQANGADLERRLDQLDLSTAAFQAVSRMCALAKAGLVAIQPYEWDDLYDILTALWKRREQAAIWHKEEETKKVTLSPLHFKMPSSTTTTFPPPAPVPLPKWLTSREERLDWEEKLQARVQQEETLKVSMQDVISSTEEMTLPMLRDALIRATMDGAAFETHVKTLAKTLLIETQQSGCAKTTRVAQAIETIQMLFFLLRSADWPARGNFQLVEGAEFDADWQWMGSYATWRAAIFVLLYPENLLVPNLRTRTTPGFRQLVRQLQGHGRVTPEVACQAAHAYEAYFRDVCSLAGLVCVEAMASILSGSCRDRRIESPRKLEFLFAFSQISQKGYWTTRPTGAEANGAYGVGFWDEIPNVAGVRGFAGAVEYSIVGGDRFILLFAKTPDGPAEKLLLLRYDLKQGIWREPIELELPAQQTSFTVKIRQFFDKEDPKTTPPRLVITLPDRTTYGRQLNAKGDDWGGDEFFHAKFLQFRDVQESVLTSFGAFIQNRGLRARFWAANEFAADQVWAANEHAGDQKFKFGFPTFHQSTMGYGTYLVTSSAVDWVDVKVSELTSLDGGGPLGVPQVGQEEVKRWFRLADQYARDHKYVGAFPTFYTPDNENGVTGLMLLKAEAATRITVRLADLGSERTVEGLFRHANDYAQGRGRGVTAFPTFRFTDADANSGPDPDSVDLIMLWGSTEDNGYWGSFLPNCSTHVQDITPAFSGVDRFVLSERRESSEWNFQELAELAYLYENVDALPWRLTYLDEASYFVPIMLALQLQASAYYQEALDWFRTVYDYKEPPNNRKCFFLQRENDLAKTISRAEDWLRDPLDPHGLAATRRNTYTRFTLLSLTRCLLDFADTEFTRDTAESLPRATALYRLALDILEMTDLKEVDPCTPNSVPPEGFTLLNGGLPILALLVPQLWDRVQKLPDIDIDRRHEFKETIKDLLTVRPEGVTTKLADLDDALHKHEFRILEPPKIDDLLATRNEWFQKATRGLVAVPAVAHTLEQVSLVADQNFVSAAMAITGSSLTQLVQEPQPWLRESDTRRRGQVDGNDDSDPSAPHMVSTSSALTSRSVLTVEDSNPYPRNYIGANLTGGGYGLLQGPLNPFCVAPNPVLRALRFHAEVNLHKLRTCRNIAGLSREVDSYAAPTDSTSGMPSIGAGGQLIVPGTTVLTPTPYRYSVLIERAKQLVSLAQQMESNMLAGLQQRDAEAYTLLKARQDVQLSRAGVKLQDLRVKQAEGGVNLAELQQQRTQIQSDHYTMLLAGGSKSDALEIASLSLLASTAALYTAAAIAAGFSSFFNRVDVVSFSAQAASTTASFLNQIASYERRKQDWEFQKVLAEQDIRIGAQQITLAQDQVRVSLQERTIAQLQTDHAETTVEFLSNKFTNVELYDWMGRILEGVYRYFLQEATSIAKLAASQLAFERQEPPPPYIQSDYWEAPSEDSIGIGTGGSPPDRRGLTGSARLLHDIYQLDQYAFQTNQRKLQLTKTLSLAQLAPVEFQRFRETGVLRIATPLELFDRDFPGHYLRLIRQVKTSVVALIPPNSGIRATLSTTGRSRVVVGPEVFQTVQVQHGPDSVALSSPLNATGLFELNPQSEMLNPFEHIGVDTTWILEMPKASNVFDYNTIGDVLLTIEYTALNSFTYRQQVVQTLRPTVSADRAFSFRHQFADAWYDLSNPDHTPTPMTVRFRTDRADFPPNLDRLRIQHVVLYFSRAASQTFEVPVTSLKFTNEGSPGSVGGAANTVDGVISTRRGNAGSWMAMLERPPFGEWELALPNLAEVRNRFQSNKTTASQITDILLVITYAGRTPEWPS